MSYQITNADLEGTLGAICDCLEAAGVLVFDCWYGPGVLSNPPRIRIKRAENDLWMITRLAEPEIHPNENRVDVHYDILVRNKKTGEMEEFREIHRVRYLFKPEVEAMLEKAGLELLTFGKWLCHEEPDVNTWSTYFVARR